MYRKHCRSLQSAKKIVKFSPSKSSFYNIVLTVQPATLPRPNEGDPNSCVVKMHGNKEKKRRGKGKRKEEKFWVLIAEEKNKTKKKQVRAHRFFRGDPCVETFHESNLKGVH